MENKRFKVVQSLRAGFIWQQIGEKPEIKLNEKGLIDFCFNNFDKAKRENVNFSKIRDGEIKFNIELSELLAKESELFNLMRKVKKGEL